MCWECDHPESSHQDFLDHMQGLIDRVGWAVAGIEADRIHPAWAYTIGLTPPLGEEVLVEGGPLMEVVRVTEPTAHLVTAVELYGPKIRALQLVYADDRGHCPWDAGFRGHHGGQPVFGVRAAPPTRRAAPPTRGAAPPTQVA